MQNLHALLSKLNKRLCVEEAEMGRAMTTPTTGAAADF